MKKIQYIILFFFIFLLNNNIINAQFAWIDPAVPDVTQEVTIYVDVAQDPGCANLINSAGPLYIWTWMPAGPAIADGNGSWDSSNEALLMNYEGGTLWSFTMIPTEFYGVDADAVYENGISFLAKEKDGGGGGDCAEGGGEFKTSDVNLAVPSPFATVRKVYSIPDMINDSLYTEKSDIFTIIYNNNAEEKASLIGVSNMYVYPRVFGDDGLEYTLVSLSQVGNYPELQMQTSGDGVFTYSMVPSEFYASLLPDGIEIATLKFQLITIPLCGSDCAVDGEFLFPYIGCQ